MDPRLAALARLLAARQQSASPSPEVDGPGPTPPPDDTPPPLSQPRVANAQLYERAPIEQPPPFMQDPYAYGPNGEFYGPQEDDFARIIELLSRWRDLDFLQRPR